MTQMPNNHEYLIDQLDLSLTGDLSENVKQEILGDERLAAEWQALRVSVAAIREAGLNDRVAMVKNSWKKEQVSDAAPRQAIVRTMYRNTLRVAAAVILIVAGVSVFKYSTTNSETVYGKYFSSYEMSTSRGASNVDLLEKAYREKNWNEVISLFNTMPEKSNKTYFLTGMANLELKSYQSAIPMFQQVLDNNSRKGESYFEDEAEYYLAMSYLGAKKAPEAIAILKKIKADKAHLYHAVVEKMSWIELSIIDYKAGK